MPTEHLHALERDGVAVRPGPEALVHAQDKGVMRSRLAELGVESGDHLKTTHYAPPAKRSKGVMVKDVAELVSALKAKGLV